MFDEIGGHIKWLKIEKINRGWSEDAKYYIETDEQQKLLLRTSDINQFEVKKKEYEIICKYANLGFKMSEPISFGVCNRNQNVYMLLTWIEGEDLELALPKLDPDNQYLLGREAGRILKKIHELRVLDNEIPHTTKIPRKESKSEDMKNQK